MFGITDFLENIKNQVLKAISAPGEYNHQIGELFTKDCIIYIRVSTMNQSVGAQQYACVEFCNKYFLNIKEIAIEKVSAYTGKKQNALNYLINKYENINLIVFSVDRFSRKNENATEFIDVMDYKKINLIAVKDNINLNTAFGKFEFRRLLNMAQYESELISERVKHSVKYRKENGIHIGRIPYGYNKINKKLVKNSLEREVIKFIIKNVKTKTTSAKLSSALYILMTKIYMNLNDFTPILFTKEDNQFEYKAFKEDEPLKITYSSMAEILNDYNIKNKGKKWTVCSIQTVCKNAYNIDHGEFNRMQV
jgi:DNA invertase Pin-like site-specific DNA recombinase